MDSDDAERIARELSPALAKRMQAELRRLRFDGSVIAGAPADWRRAAKIDPRDQQL